jgi:hypothetical protein
MASSAGTTTLATMATTLAARMGTTMALGGVGEQQHGLVYGDDDAGHHSHAGGCYWLRRRGAPSGSGEGQLPRAPTGAGRIVGEGQRRWRGWCRAAPLAWRQASTRGRREPQAAWPVARRDSWGEAKQCDFGRSISITPLRRAVGLVRQG